MSDAAVKAAVKADGPAICALWNAVIAETTITFTSTPKAPDAIIALIDTQPVFVARSTDGGPDGEAVGFATVGPFRGGDGYAHVMEHAIYLSAQARGLGLGRALLSAVEDAARAAGALSLIAGISGENAGGIAFHAAMGFRQVGHIPEAGRKFGRLIDLVLMQKRLG